MNEDIDLRCPYCCSLRIRNLSSAILANDLKLESMWECELCKKQFPLKFMLVEMGMELQ